MNTSEAKLVLAIMSTSKDRVRVRAMFEKFDTAFPAHETILRRSWSELFNEHWCSRNDKND